MLLNSPQPSSDSYYQDNPEQQPPKLNTDHEFIHHITPTFLGPICTACHCKVANGNILFDISRISIKKHITTNKCYIGDITLFKGRELEKTLHTSMIHQHNSMRDNPSLAPRMVERFNFVSSSKNCPTVLNAALLAQSCAISDGMQHHNLHTVLSQM
jgi:hypothetical protein